MGCQRSPDGLRCHWSLRSLPLDFTRHLRLCRDTLHLHYRIQNRADTPTPYQWAWQPLFSLEEGDQLVFDPAPETCLTADGLRLPWPAAAPGQDLSRADVADADPSWAKVFVETPGLAGASIRSPRGSARLEWDGRILLWAAVWITRGAWNGLHHWAVEPTNLAADHLSDAARGDPLTTLPAHGVRDGGFACAWSVPVTNDASLGLALDRGV